MARKGPIGISDSYTTNSDVTAASTTALKAAYDITNARFNVVTVTTVEEIESKQNGWYFVASATIADVSGSWIITRFGNASATLYTATNINDPRVVLNSVNLSTWYSPYGSWHV